jgi:hypothetical protein
MSTSDRTRSFLALGTLCTLFLAADAVFAAFARGHYLPARKLDVALATPNVDVLVAGDSRMVAALDVSALKDGWRECGARVPEVVDLSLGGVDIAGQAVAVRRFFDRGSSSKLVVLGTVPESLASQPTDPDGWIGNEGIVLWWSRLSDFDLHFPRRAFRLDPVVLDEMFRFVAYRASSVSSLRSLLWYRAQRLQDAVLRRPQVNVQTNLGAEDDMRALAERFIDQGRQAARIGIEGWQISAWACELRKQVEAAGARLVVVELPMPAAYQVVRASALGQELRRRLPGNFCGRAIEWIGGPADMTFAAANFPDGLHLDKVSAATVSRQIGCELATRPLVERQQ